jgi:hypothetical protein
MGRCYYYTGDGREHCVPASDKSACDGRYENTTDETCPPDCFFVTELTSYAIAKSAGDTVIEVSAHPGILVACDFREVILLNSTLGQEAVELYVTHARTAIEGLRKHPKLFFRAMRLTVTGILLAQDMLRAHWIKGRAGKLTLHNATTLEAMEVARELGKHINTKEFDHLVSRVEWFFKEIDGMTTAELLKFLAVKKPRTKK